MKKTVKRAKKDILQLSPKQAAKAEQASRDKMKAYGDIPDPRPRTPVAPKAPKKKPTKGA